MNYLIFNKTCVINTPIEGNNSNIVRTGGIYNENDPSISFINALLHSNIKKYGSISESDRMIKIQKLKDDLLKKLKNTEKFKLKISSFLEIIKENLLQFYKYLSSNDFNDFKVESNKKFSIRLCNDGDTEKIQLFKLLSEIITIEDFNKIFKMTEKKWIDNDTYCIIDYNKNLQKETLRFLSYKEVFDDIDKKKSDFFIKNIICMINELVKISFEHLSDDKNFFNNQITKDKIDILSNYMELNIVFIDNQTRLPLFLGSETNLNNDKKTVILFSFDLKHFEIIGKHLPDDRIQRTFMPYDDVVKNIIHYSSLKSSNTENKIPEVKIEPHVENKIPEVNIEQHVDNKIPEVNIEPLEQQQPIENKNTIVEQQNTEDNKQNIYENIHYNSDDDMLKDLGDNL